MMKKIIFIIIAILLFFIVLGAANAYLGLKAGMTVIAVAPIILSAIVIIWIVRKILNKK